MAKILHVEDEQYWIELIRGALQDHQVHSASSAQEALAFIIGAAEPYDLAIVDLNLVGSGDHLGGEVLDVLASRHPATRRIVVTGAPPTGAIRKNIFERYGVDEIIIKTDLSAPGLRRVVDEQLNARVRGSLGSDGPVDPSVEDGKAGDSAGITEVREATEKARKVFVVHGRDEAARHAMFDFLRALDLRPLEWEEVVEATKRSTPFIGEAIPLALSEVQAVVILLTPDDVAYLHPDLRSADEPPFEGQPTGQARPNVLFEAGIAFGIIPDRTIIVEIGSLRPFSDLGGRNVVRIAGGVEALQKLVRRLSGAGCAVNDSGADWTKTSRFEELAALTRRPM